MEGEFAKTMLKVGTYHSPDGVVVVTPERLRHWERQVQAIQSVGYAIPSHFDHASDEELLTPISEAELRLKQSRSAKNTVGKLKSFRVSPDGHSAEIVLHTLDPDATKSVASNAVYVSPVIHPKWKDGAGNQYPDALTSFDLVDWPVDHSQSSFTPLVRMGQRVCPAIRMGASKPYILERSRMSTVAKEKKSLFRRALQRMSTEKADGFYTTPSGQVRPITVGGEEYLDDDHKPAGKYAKKGRGKSARSGRKGKKKMSVMRMGADEEGYEKEEGKEGSPESEAKDETAQTEVVDAVDDFYDSLDEVLDLLDEFGVTLPDDTDDDSVMANLRAALTALLAAAGAGEEIDEEEVEDMDSQPNAMPQPVTPTIATMSVQQRKALERAAVAERALAESHKATTTQRLASLLKSGRCTPAEHDAQLRTLGTVRMSMTDDGSFKPNRIDYFIEDRESVPEGTYWTDKQRTQAIGQRLSVVEPPDSITSGGGRSHSEYAEAVRALGGNPDE